MQSRTQRGFSLVEGSATLAVASILAVSAAPGYWTFLDKRSVEGLAAEVATDLQLTRSEAVARNQNLKISFGLTPSGRSCYVLHTEPTGSCACTDAGPATCSAGALEIKTVRAPGDGRTSFAANVSGMVYESNRGTTTPGGSIDIAGAGGHSLRHVVSMLGRVRTCSPDGSMTRYRRC
jgi:type IV fimbrial biogenesis protein FimT